MATVMEKKRKNMKEENRNINKRYPLYAPTPRANVPTLGAHSGAWHIAYAALCAHRVNQQRARQLATSASCVK